MSKQRLHTEERVVRVLVIFNHPYEGSFCAAILEAVQKGLLAAGHGCDVINLDEDKFDPVMRSKDLRAFAMARTRPDDAAQLLDPQVAGYKDRMEQAEHIVFIFPIWWELMPAMMKGFIDKVIFPGIVYNQTDGKNGGMVCRLTALRGVTVVTTMNTPSMIYRILFGNAVKRALLTGTFWKIGVRNRRWINLTSVKSRTQKRRQEWLAGIETRMQRLS
jgi:NAD(P)H dehydrogenase (quinone)